MIDTETLERGCFYHIYNRGNNRGIIFQNEDNYLYFLKLLKKHILPVIEVYAYCLINNHFHLLIRVKDESSNPEKSGIKAISQYFSNLFNSYAKAFNKKHNRTGKLFEERFRRKKISDDNYFTELVYYIYSNPQKHGIIKDFRNYRHSSYLSIISDKQTDIKRNEVLEWFGGKGLFEAFHEDIHKELDNQRSFEIDREF